LARLYSAASDLELYSDDLGQNVLLEGEIGVRAIQAGILVAQLP